MSASPQNQPPLRPLERLLFVCLLLGAVVGFGFFEGLFSSIPSMPPPCANLIYSEQTTTNHPTLTTTDNVTRITSLHTDTAPQIYAYDSPHQPTPTSPAPLIIAGFLLTATTKPRRKTPATPPPLHLRYRQATTTASNTTYHYGDLMSPPHAKRHFSSQTLDTETGLYYYGYRYYDTLTGRWMSKDPLGELGGVNLYGFVGNDGIMFVDLLGLAGDSNTSLSIDKNWRIDIEDHSAKDRNLHIQDKATKTKYFYDPNDGKFKTKSGSLLPKDIQKIINNNRKYTNKIKNNIKKIKSLGGFAGVFVKKAATDKLEKDVMRTSFAGVFVKKAATVITIGFAVKNVSEAHAAGAGYIDASKYGAAGVVSVSESMHEELGGKIVIITYQICRVCKPGVGWLDRRINDMFEAMRLQDGGWKIKGCRTEQEKVFIK